jgi:hypothetical protein
MDLTNDKQDVLDGEWMINHRHSIQRMSFSTMQTKPPENYVLKKEYENILGFTAQN